ncbi:hypothetical protein Gohar_006489 [Gossypium harknessii]|uniref:DUF4283 domain-containing protein n=1 Tax=Gossypium harknessii TaxID=34285 RepID=A0A7J9GDK0_9ROSI|nr:hypothetical protein [Gossypium harknessii]
MEEVLIGLQITDEEEEAWQLYRDSSLQQLDYDLCLVEFFLTASVVHFLAIQNMLANLWHPIRGVQISDRGEKRFLFRFYHKSTPPPVLFDLAPLALSQTVASEASVSSPALSTQLTPPTIAAFSA